MTVERQRGKWCGDFYTVDRRIGMVAMALVLLLLSQKWRHRGPPLKTPKTRMGYGVPGLPCLRPSLRPLGL